MKKIITGLIVFIGLITVVFIGIVQVTITSNNQLTKVRAVDFTGKKGEFSDPITFTKQ